LQDSESEVEEEIWEKSCESAELVVLEEECDLTD